MTNNDETVVDMMDNVLRRHGISDDFIRSYKNAAEHTQNTINTPSALSISEEESPYNQEMVEKIKWLAKQPSELSFTTFGEFEKWVDEIKEK